MLDDFFVRALLAGIGIAIMSGPFGCFIIWRRMAYFGDTLAHAALLGVTLGLLFELNLTLSIFVVSAIIATALVSIQKRATLSSDSLLGILSHASLAIGLVTLSTMVWLNVDISSLLFGDILSVSKSDLAVVYLFGGFVLIALFAIWKQLFASCVSEEIALAEGLHPERTNLLFVLLMAAIIAVSIKIIGVLLITALLIIPAASARRLSNGPEQMALLASLIGVSSVVTGLYGSLAWDTPSGPSIVVAAFAFFLLVMLAPIAKSRPRTGEAENG